MMTQRERWKNSQQKPLAAIKLENSNKVVREDKK